MKQVAKRRRFGNWLSKPLLAAIFMLIGSCSSVEFRVLDPSPYFASERDEAWRQDLRYLEDNLHAYHSGLYHEISEEDFTVAVARLRNEIPALTDNQIKIEFARILAMVGDQHTALQLIHPLVPAVGKYRSGDFADYMPRPEALFRRYPIQAYWFSDGLYVTASTAEYRKALGAKIVQIGTAAPENIMASVEPLISHSTPARVDAESPKFITSPEILHALGIIEDMESALFTFEKSDGSRYQLTLEPYDPYLLSDKDAGNLKFTTGVLSPIALNQNPMWESALQTTDEDLPLYLSNPFSLYWYEYLEELNAVYFQFNLVRDEEEQDFATFFSEMLRFIDERHVDKLIMDLRFNPGGNFTITEEPIADLATHRINDAGKLFIIVGRETGSAAIAAANLIREQSNAIFYGETVSDVLLLYWSNLPVILPNSQLGFVNAQGPPLFGVRDEVFSPDVTVRLSSDDYLAGRDVALEEILGR
jgi:hypothetical protein